MKGVSSIIAATGEPPVYPGHPLVIAWQIMAIYPSPEEALKHERDIACPAAVADSRVAGGGMEVHSACLLIKHAANGLSASALIEMADGQWAASNGGGYTLALKPAQRQADKLKPFFAEKLASWLRAARRDRQVA